MWEKDWTTYQSSDDIFHAIEEIVPGKSWIILMLNKWILGRRMFMNTMEEETVAPLIETFVRMAALVLREIRAKERLAGEKVRVMNDVTRLSASLHELKGNMPGIVDAFK